MVVLRGGGFKWYMVVLRGGGCVGLCEFDLFIFFELCGD